MIRQLAANLFSRAANKLQPRTPEERDYNVVVTGAGDPQAESVRAKSTVQAAELAAGKVAKHRLAKTPERSWRLVALVGDVRHEVVVQCVLKSEVVS